jgi:hypothetical protein
LDLSGYEVLVVHVDESASDTNTYTVILKDTEPLPRRPDGREQSTVSWEHDFRLGGSSGGRLLMRFDDFKPTYRGRLMPDAAPLNRKKILSMSIMMRRCVPSIYRLFAMPTWQWGPYTRSWFALLADMETLVISASRRATSH